jgi:hypothetical protein
VSSDDRFGGQLHGGVHLLTAARECCRLLWSLCPMLWQTAAQQRAPAVSDARRRSATSVHAGATDVRKPFVNLAVTDSSMAACTW